MLSIVAYLLSCATLGTTFANAKLPGSAHHSDSSVSANVHMSAAQLQWQPVKCPLPTQWTSKVDSKAPLGEYPRPLMARKQWTNLNGVWQWESASSPTSWQDPPFGKDLSASVLVPFPVESCISGVNATHPYMFYRLVFDKPAWTGDMPSTLLHFGAIDWESHAWLNGKQIFGNHTGEIHVSAFMYQLCASTVYRPMFGNSVPANEEFVPITASGQSHVRVLMSLAPSCTSANHSHFLVFLLNTRRRIHWD